MKRGLTGFIALGILAILFLGLKSLFNSKPNLRPSFLAEDVVEGGPSSSVKLTQSSPNPVSSIPPISERDRELEKVLSQIFRSKNDNDPRMDTEFKNLTPGTKYLLEKKYESFPLEARNERGTVAFLIARDLEAAGTADDFVFLNRVASEPPCLSLADCSRETKAGPEDSHEESTIGVTLTYPQRILIYSLGDFLKQHPDSPLASNVVQTLETLGQSTVPAVAAKAHETLSQYSSARH
jgi:hypothetical protein